MKYFHLIYLSLSFANYAALSQKLYFEAVSSFCVPENRTVPLSLVVPTIFSEVNCFKQMLTSLELSTLFPRESVIVASGAGDLNNKDALLILKSLIQNAMVPNLKLVLLQDLHLQSASRNIGANMTSQPFIAFFDADDYLHPQRFEILNNVLVEHPEVHLLLHMWQRFTTVIPEIRNITTVNITLYPYDVFQAYKTKEVVKQRHNPYRVRYLIWLFPELVNIANGHNTMARKVWESIPQITAPGAEDSIQNMEIIKKGFNTMVIEPVLLFYRVRVRKMKTC
jgi:glycosyltransferase involved in cell wall biosynthesis